jgi:hypothetical protein
VSSIGSRYTYTCTYPHDNPIGKELLELPVPELTGKVLRAFNLPVWSPSYLFLLLST